MKSNQPVGKWPRVKPAPQEPEAIDQTLELESINEKEQSDSFDRSFSDRIEDGYSMHSME